MSPRSLAATAVALLLASSPMTALAQEGPPPGLDAYERGRSRTCVPVLEQLDDLDRRLSPLAIQSQRLLAIAQAIAIEERAVIDSLDTSDPVEAEIRAWFVEDAGLAERYVASPDSALLAERIEKREAIKVTVAEAVQAVQDRADEMVTATGSLQAEASRCSGVVLVRGSVLEACGASTSALCEAARDSAVESQLASPYRFVDTPEDLWGMQEMRAWSAPTALQVSPSGQLGGARTLGFTRMGNVVVNVAFRPLLQDRSELSPEELERITQLNDSIGVQGEHPDLVFIPSVALQLVLPEAISGESRYVVHFGTAEAADVLWTGLADTGNPLEGVVDLSISDLVRLQSGQPLTLTAIREGDAGENEGIYQIELTSLRQAQSVQTLLGYMAQQLTADLLRLIPPDGS